MKTTAAVSTPSGVRVEEVQLLPSRHRDVLVRVEGANVAIADAFTFGADPGPGFPGPGGPGPGFPGPGGPGPGGPGPGFPGPGGPGPGGPGPGFPEMPGEALAALVNMPKQIVNGHAGVGVVEEIGPGVSRVRVGDRVLITSNPNCGVCAYCLRGRPDQCAEMVPIGPAYAVLADGTEVHANGSVGCFAELAVVPETQLTPVTTDLPADQLSLIANPVATGVGAALIIAPIQPGSVVAVLGCGPVGLSYIQGARLAKADQIIAIDPLPHRREAASRLGATAVVDPGEIDPVEAVRELSGDVGGLVFGRGADYTFEAAGDATAAEQAWNMARLTGHVTLAGMGGQRPTVTFPYAEFSILAGRTVHSCQWGGVLQRRDFPWLIKLAERGELDVAGMAERNYALKEISDAFRDVNARAVIGATLLPAS